MFRSLLDFHAALATDNAMNDRAHTLTARKAFIQKPHSIPAIDVGALVQFRPFCAKLANGMQLATGH